MFRPMRRKKQLLSMEVTEEILYRGQNGVLAVIGDDDYPYAVPLSYVYEKGKLYFHCAKDGHKIDGLSRNDKVSFAVIDEDQIVPEKFTTYFRSVILFGKARVVLEESLKRHVLGLLVRKYSSGFEREGEDEINKDIKTVCVVEVTIENISGKEAIEFVKVK